MKTKYHEQDQSHVPRLCLTADEVAEEIGISVSLVRRLTRFGNLPHIRVGRRIIYPAAAINSWLAEHTEFGNPASEEGEHNA